MPDISKEAYDQLVRARCALILNQPFFGTLALRLQLKEDNSIPTLAVDGRTMFYNAQFVKSLNANLTKAAVAHEVGHCIFNHIGRRAGRDPRLWNCAGDFVINDMLKQSGFSLGEGWLHNPAYSGMTADHIYDLLKQEARDGSEGKGPGDPLCDIRDGEGGGQIDPVLANEWKVATIQAAAAAQAQGNLPAPMKRFVDELVGSIDVALFHHPPRLRLGACEDGPNHRAREQDGALFHGCTSSNSWLSLRRYAVSGLIPSSPTYPILVRYRWALLSHH